MDNHRKLTTGFALPVVLVISLSVLIVVTSILAVTSVIYSRHTQDHYQRLADEAAEAGTAYATACLSLSGHTQTWGSAVSKPNLSPQTDCSGASTYTSNQYIYSDSTVRSYFTVGNLDYSAQFSAQVSAQGFVDALRPDGSVIRTYTSVQKKVLAWPTDINAQMSTSGTNRTCAVVSGKVYCWGLNAYGQLGDGRYLGPPASIGSSSSVDSSVPVKVLRTPGGMAGVTITKVFTAQYHSCALGSNGLVYCWGYNSNGQLGDGTTTDSPVPLKVGGALASKTVTDIGGSQDTSCAIADGKIYCWGRNTLGSAGVGYASESVTTPTLVSAPGGTNFLASNYTATALAASGSRSPNMCAVADGKAYCWGPNETGQIGDNTLTERDQPTKVYDGGVLSGKTVTAVSQDGYPTSMSGGKTHVCAVASGSVYCWGENNNGQLGNNSTTDSRVPVAVVTSGALNGLTIQDVQVGLVHSCVRASGGAYCWGSNASGMVGDGTFTTRRTPVAVATDPAALSSSNVVTIGAGANRGCAVITDGRTFCWGHNNSGQIGDGTKIDRNVPTESLFLRPSGNQYIF